MAVSLPTASPAKMIGFVLVAAIVVRTSESFSSFTIASSRLATSTIGGEDDHVALARDRSRRRSFVRAGSSSSSSSSIAENDDAPRDGATSRRGFLTESASAAATATTAIASSPGVARATETPAAAASASSSLEIPPMGLGAWAWGDSLYWGYDPKKDDELREVFDYATRNSPSGGVALFDTAELYGIGRSESLIGAFNKASPPEQSRRVRVATKFAALPWRTTARNVVDACRASLDRLDGTPIDLYQIHFPNAWANEAYWDGLAECYERGLVRAVGVSNYGVDATRAVHARLRERGVPLATNQIQLSLLYRYPLENGLLDVCRELDVTVLSYSPLAEGFLTGKYDRDNLPQGPRKTIGETLFAGESSEAFEELSRAMRAVAARYGTSDAPATLAQVALNWTRAKGTVPIPGARTVRQAKQNLDALSWSLSNEDVKALDDAASKVPSYYSVDKSPFPKKDVFTGLTMFDS